MKSLRVVVAIALMAVGMGAIIANMVNQRQYQAISSLGDRLAALEDNRTGSILQARSKPGNAKPIENLVNLDSYGETIGNGVWPIIPGTWKVIREQRVYEVDVNIDGFLHRIPVDPSITGYSLEGPLSAEEIEKALNGSAYKKAEIISRRTPVHEEDRGVIDFDTRKWVKRLIK